MSKAIQFASSPVAVRLTAALSPTHDELTKGFEALFTQPTDPLASFEIANDNGQSLIASAMAVKQLISSYSLHLPKPVRSGLLKQVDRLFAPEEFEPSDALPSIDSFRCLLRALVVLRPLKRPNLGLSDDGAFLAAWFDEGARLSLKFLPNDMVHWISFFQIEPSENRGSGKIAANDFTKIVEAYGLRWLIDGEVRPHPRERYDYAMDQT